MLTHALYYTTALQVLLCSYSYQVLLLRQQTDLANAYKATSARFLRALIIGLLIMLSFLRAIRSCHASSEENASSLHRRRISEEKE
ncbi:hypothetical protein F4801DRAFT_554948 [Xylaria longipes]|nr:hypothetical protein F4801DRAFT_554948 [Xylaria longipes]